MKIPNFLKKKTTYVILALLIGGGVWVSYSRSKSAAPVYETAAVERGDVSQTVEVTGEIKPASRIDLAFKNTGTLKTINVKVGDSIKQGDVLAELKADDVQFAVRQAAASLNIAQANLNQRAAGETAQSIRVAETQVEQSQASYDKAVADLAAAKLTTQDAVNSSEIALQTAKNNLDNQGAIIGQNVQNAYDSARTQLLTALGPLNTGLADGDQITGVDNSAANQAYASQLGFLDFGSMERAKSSYRVAKDARLAASTALNALTTASTPDQIQAAANLLQRAITLVQAYLTDVQAVLAATTTSSSFTSSDLASKKATIDGDRTSVSAQSTAVLNALQLIKNSSLTQTQTSQQLQDAYQTALTANATAKTNAEINVRTAQTNVTIQQATLDSSKANLDLKKSGPRAVDLAPLRASVEQAAVAYDKAKNDLLNVEIIAPVDGIVSEVLPSIGEQISQSSPAIRMVGTQMYTIEAQVPEADVTKIVVGQAAQITLDAYGDDVKFTGTVIAKDPAETRVQDAIYYKIQVEVVPGGREVKPGMTANVTITTGESKSTLVIPLRAVRTDDAGQKTVRVLLNNVAETKTIELGLKGDEGRVEVKSGLNVGDQVIVGETSTATAAQ